VKGTEKAASRRIFITVLILTACLSGFAMIRKRYEAPGGKWQSYRDLKYGRDVMQSLDLYVPANARGCLPVVVFIHGGGWVAGDKSMATFFELSKKGYALASINYRLIWEAAFPAQIQDCKGAIAFLRSNAGKYKLDPDHIAVWGCSSGGQLAMLLATTGNGEVPEWESECRGVPTRVEAVCDWAGPSDLVSLIRTRPLDKYIRSYTKNLVGPPGTGREAKWVLASPVRYVKRGDPPVLIMHAKGDETIPISQSEELFECLKSKGVESQLIAVDAPQHSFYTQGYEAIVAEFFNRIFQRPHWGNLANLN
jgi:acetyl esterase/lipase